MRIMYTFTKISLFLVGILIFSLTWYFPTSTFAESQTVIVNAGESERLTFYMIEGDFIEYWINVDGGSNDDINFKLRNPIGGTMVSGGIIESHSDSWYAQYDGNYVFEFDNGISILSDKRVDFTYEITKKPTVSRTVEQASGGCLIATATYGTELAPQVQFLREIRDNTLLSTESGTSFMTGFNSIYYSFSPAVADLERESSIFREAVKLLITPMLSTLSIMTLAEQGSEYSILGLGISVIALNLGMYVAVPVTITWQIKKRIQSS